MTPFVLLSYDLELPHLRAADTNASALYQSAATEQLSSERCEHLSQMTEMPNDGRAVRPAMSRIQSIARPWQGGQKASPAQQPVGQSSFAKRARLDALFRFGGEAD
jgi:hypothetical protein